MAVFGFPHRLALSRAARRWAPGLSAPLVALAAWLTWELARLPDVTALRWRNPETTAFIERRKAQSARVQEPQVRWIWVPWDAISVHMKRAAVAAEDMEFFFHDGFSRAELTAALREALAGERLRGASTITQQVAKNLWLSPSRNPLRKLKEALLTRRLERDLSKRRILEIYLNVAEFGRGIYGVEAAARAYFGKPARDLTEREAAMLAAALPRPSQWHPGVASRSYERYVEEIRRRMERAEFLWRYVDLGRRTSDVRPRRSDLRS